MASSISVKSLKLDAFLSKVTDSVQDVLVDVQSEAALEQLSGRSKGVNIFTASFTAADNVDLYTTLYPNSDETRSWSKSAMAYMLQTWLFPNDALSGNNWITNPFTGTSVSALHCISFSNHLYKDKLLGFNSDLIFSITGNISTGNFFGYGSYGTEDFIFTETTQEALESNDFSGLNTDNQGLIPHLDELEIDYSIIAARFYYKITPNPQYYKIRGILLKDYGLVVLFDNRDNWVNWDNIENIHHFEETSFTGSETDPAIYFEVNGTTIDYKYQEQRAEKRINVQLPWDKANYSANKTARDEDTGEYKFTEIENINELISLDKEKRPRTYITRIYLLDDQLDIVAIAKPNSPIKKDFLTNINFKIKVQV